MENRVTENRDGMLKRVQMTAFAAHEAGLYLDTHPHDARALEYFRQYQTLTRKLTAEFEAKYGPLSTETAAQGSWKWVCGPWPWEPEANA